ncbi:aminotransferase-like domain-containing protein [Andreprevotia chitinilytica]|uniref:aminotransferase-like domain-containing protein n=1 Tax=Andreprevotia chitinilytica TaxID=396808 RepID=UPI000558A503|nr:PLP-dependent aminotransferase family protein [Andreprevotia chitinilytica]
MNTLAPPAEVSIESSRLDVMNFLNEMANDFPDAISFVSGRPSEQFFDLEHWIKRIPEFVHYYADRQQIDFARAMNQLAQYGRTNGVINELIARQVGTDEGIECASSQVLITAGCQEAMDLCVKVLCRDADDVVLVRSPTYIGITGAAELNGVRLAAFTADSEALLLPALQEKVRELEQQGKCPRVLYLVPDFDNPTGEVLSRQTREDVIAFCAAKRIVVLEDNPYGMFRFEGERIQPMQALDTQGCVVYLGTYSKTICPTLRIGFVVVPAHLFGSKAAAAALLGRLSQAKSFAAVNTSQITQAIAGGLLLAEGCSVAQLVAPVVSIYRRNRDALIHCLQAAFADYADQITWNTPTGGFFLNITLPFEFKRQEAECCAKEYKVLVMPLSYFALDEKQDYRVRMAYSNITPALIEDGVQRFAAFIKDRLATGAVGR